MFLTTKLRRQRKDQQRRQRQEMLDRQREEELRRLQDRERLVELCESMDVTPTRMQLRALASLPSDADRRDFIREMIRPRRDEAALFRTAALDDDERQQLLNRWSK